MVISIFLQNPGRRLPGPQSKREKLLRRGGEGGAGMLGPEYRSSPANIQSTEMYDIGWYVCSFKSYSLMGLVEFIEIVI